MLTDGDAGGKERLKQIAPLLKAHKIEGKQLLDKTTIEDHLPLAGELYVRAVTEAGNRRGGGGQASRKEVVSNNALRAA